jgi:hypothetical protein
MPDGTAAALLASIEALPRAASGALLIGGPDAPPAGAVLIEQNRVCFAVIAGRGRRLRDLLHLTDQTALDGLDDAVMRAGLKQHTVESLIHLDGRAAATTWLAHRGEGYRSRHTFSAAELLVAIGAQLYAAESSAEHGLEDVLPDGAIGASFVAGDDGEAVAVREIGGAKLGVDGLGQLGTWAVSALDVTPGFSAPVMSRALAAARGRAALAWRGGRRLVHAMVIDDPIALSRTVAELDRRGRPAVLSLRAPGASAPT